MRFVVVAALAALCSGCATTEKVTFRPTQQQEAIVRDGNPALVSKRKSSIVLVRPARQMAQGARPVFVVGITNISGAPLNFRVADVEAFQVVNQQQSPLKVITYEQLVSEERNRQIAAAILTGIAAGANSYSASRAGYYNSHSTVMTSGGRIYNVSTTGYSPAAAAIAQSNANVQNAAMINNAVERGQQNMAALEATVIKDNTLMPNEWYGGQLHLSPLESNGVEGGKNYKIAIRVGPDLHEIDIIQEAVK